jgi:predicted house-cleaning noncanonical NTP pyrophosphatase (MazG superfamily)
MKKLVRDKIPEMILQEGKTPIFRKLNDSEYEHQLIIKFQEEIGELIAARTLEQKEDELGDIAEIVRALIDFYGIKNRINFIGYSKREERGGFDERIFLEDII